MDQKIKDLNDLCEQQRKLIEEQGTKIAALIVERAVAQKAVYDLSRLIDTQPVAAQQHAESSKPTHEQAMAGYAVACRYGVMESRAFQLTDDMFGAFGIQQNAQAALSDELIAAIQAEGVCTGYGEGIRRARAILAASQQPAAAAAREQAEQRQRERMAERFASRAPMPATADFDLPAPNDAPAIQAQDERAEFEKTASILGYTLLDKDEVFNGTYHCSERTERAWKIWQARAALAAPAPVQPVPVADAAPVEAKPVARLTYRDEPNELFDIVILDRARCIDGMELFAAQPSRAQGDAKGGA